MSFAFVRSSPSIVALYSWLHGTRLQIGGAGHRVERHAIRWTRQRNVAPAPA